MQGSSWMQWVIRVVAQKMCKMCSVLCIIMNKQCALRSFLKECLHFRIMIMTSGHTVKPAGASQPFFLRYTTLQRTLGSPHLRGYMCIL